MNFDTLTKEAKIEVINGFYAFLQSRDSFCRKVTLKTVRSVFKFVNPKCYKNTKLWQLDLSDRKGYDDVYACCIESVNPAYSK